MSSFISRVLCRGPMPVEDAITEQFSTTGCSPKSRSSRKAERIASHEDASFSGRSEIIQFCKQNSLSPRNSRTRAGRESASEFEQLFGKSDDGSCPGYVPDNVRDSCSSGVKRSSGTRSEPTSADLVHLESALSQFSLTVTRDDSAHEANIPENILNKLQLLTVAGKGSYGTVYRAELDSKMVAVKVSSFENYGNLTPDAEFARQSAAMEAEICSSLSHPNVIPTMHTSRAITTSATTGQPVWEQYLVQELCDGDLSQVLNRKLMHDERTGLVCLEAVLQMAIDIASGLQYINSCGVIHGDVNPRNILISLKPECLPLGCTGKLTDFGLSHRLPKGKDQVDGIKHGTPFYAAPEVVDEGIMSCASDVFSFGVVLWEMYTGETPFKSKRQPSKSGFNFEWNPMFPNLPETCPRTLKDLVYACLHAKPNRRPEWNTIINLLRNMLARLQGQ